MFKLSFGNKFTDALTKLTIIEILLIQICLFYCFVYNDIIITTKHGILLWDCVFEGNTRSFYDIALQRVTGAYYDFVMYIIFAIWDLPLWLVQKCGLADNSLNYLGGMLWAKSIILFFVFVCLYYMWKILKLAGNFSKYELLFLFSTDIFVTAFLCIVGQYDIIATAFMLAGLYYYLIGSYKKFIMAFAIAIPIKAFALLLFIPILLQKEKNLLKIIYNVILVLIPVIMSRVIVPISSHQEGSNVSLLLGAFLDNSLIASNGRFSVFLVCYIIFVAYCYIHTFTDLLYDSLVTSVFAFAIFLLLTNPNPYWWFYLAPFIVLLIMLNHGSVVLQLFSMVGEFAIFLHLIWRFELVFNPVNFGNGILKYVIPVDNSYVNGPANMFNALLPRIAIKPEYQVEMILSIGFICLWLFAFSCRKKISLKKDVINSTSNIVFVNFFRLVTVASAYTLMFLQLKYV